MVGVHMRIGGTPSTTEVRAVAVAVTAAVTRSNQGSPTTEKYCGDPSMPVNPDTESAFTTEVRNTPNTYTRVSICVAMRMLSLAHHNWRSPKVRNQKSGLLCGSHRS